MKRQKKSDQPRWATVAIMIHTAVRGNRRIAVAVSGEANDWGAVAVEAPADAASPLAIFADHSHHALGNFKSLSTAIAAAEAYVAAWEPSPEQCDCGEIGGFGR